MKHQIIVINAKKRLTIIDNEFSVMIVNISYLDKPRSFFGPYLKNSVSPFSENEVGLRSTHKKRRKKEVISLPPRLPMKIVDKLITNW